MDFYILEKVNKESLVSVINKTKWQKLAEAMSVINPEVRIKCIDDEQVCGFSCLDWEWVKHGKNEYIEWIEISPIRRIYQGSLLRDKEIDISTDVEKTLKVVNCPFSYNDNLYKIWGYINPKNIPEFV